MLYKRKGNRVYHTRRDCPKVPHNLLSGQLYAFFISLHLILQPFFHIILIEQYYKRETYYVKDI
jgi:hypothetical protein